MSAIQSELDAVQRRHSAVKSFMAGELRLGNKEKYKELEKEFVKLTTQLRKLEQQVLDEQRTAEEAAKKAVKNRDISAPVPSGASYESLMANVHDVDKALADISKSLAKEKDNQRQNALRAEASKLRTLWSKLVKAARDAKNAGR